MVYGCMEGEDTLKKRWRTSTVSHVPTRLARKELLPMLNDTIGKWHTHVSSKRLL
jgi:hypothetical protein